jgi:hypothetical protein
MTTSELDREVAAKSWIKGFYTTSILFNICLIAQVLTVGVAYFTDPAWWNVHIWLVRGYSGLSLILGVGAYIAPFSPKIQRLAASLPLLLGVQFCSIHLKTPLHLEVLHPLVGFMLFYVSSTLVHEVGRSLSP